MQGLENGFQSESPDTWLTNGNPWEIPRRDLAYKIGFYGSVQNGKWIPEEQVSFSHLFNSWNHADRACRTHLTRICYQLPSEEKQQP